MAYALFSTTPFFIYDGIRLFLFMKKEYAIAYYYFTKGGYIFTKRECLKSQKTRFVIAGLTRNLLIINIVF